MIRQPRMTVLVGLDMLITATWWIDVRVFESARHAAFTV
jgi:hypothetical protein